MSEAAREETRQRLRELAAQLRSAPDPIYARKNSEAALRKGAPAAREAALTALRAAMRAAAETES